MKFFFIGYHNPNFLSITECIERAIKRSGHTLMTADYRDWLIPGRLRDRISALNSWDMKRINGKILKQAMYFHPDVMLVNGGYTIFPETILEIKHRLPDIRTVNWIADFPLLFDKYTEVGPYYDFFFTSGTDALEEYRKTGAENGFWLPFACDPELHRPVNLTLVEKLRYACDVCFVGSKYSERVGILEKLTDFDLGVWGIGWDKLEDGSPLRKAIRGSTTTLEIWRKIFSAAKIVLNIIGDCCDIFTPYYEKDVFKMVNTRTFEALACGAFQLADLKADILALFQPGKHLVVYEQEEELPELLRFYLGKETARRKIAENGRNLVLQKHTYEHRIHEMLEVIRAYS